MEYNICCTGDYYYFLVHHGLNSNKIRNNAQTSVMNLIRQIEDVSMNSWPALQTIHYDGWVLRFAEGLTKRSNSVYPVYDSRIDVSKKISYCENLYQLKNLPACFKITEIAQPNDLDEILDAKGYHHEFDISVQ